MDRSNLNSQLEHLQSKYVGTGHADTSKYEWGVNQARDTYASYIGHYPMLSYFAVAENESIARVKFNIAEVPIDTHITSIYFLVLTGFCMIADRCFLLPLKENAPTLRASAREERLEDQNSLNIIKEEGYLDVSHQCIFNKSGPFPTSYVL
ncbi:Casein kinase I isoform delta [Mortierella sp. AM989]|nr:Casein kinase I isoform delta [Mortierella sp. AM989]